ncbi:MAG: hypothetical protein V7695_19930 [Sulfitobacter sp.]
MAASYLRRTLNDFSKVDYDQRAGIQAFTSLDVERVADDLQLSQQGEQRGKENLPPASSASADLVESSILDRVSEHMRSQIEALRFQQSTYGSRLAQIDISSQSIAAITKAPSVQQFKAEKERGIDGLYEVGQRVKETRREREQFRKTNKLERVARVPSGGKTFLAFALLVTIFLTESFLNGSFLAEGNRLGLLGGVSLAAGFAFVNILAAWGTAKYMVRNILRRNFFWKLAGLLGLFSYGSFAVGLNLTLAHYRDQSAKYSDQLGVRVLEQLESNPWELADINSVLLLFIGIGFSLIAFIDGWQWTDPFPGYADIEKRYLRALEDYEDIRAANIDELESIYYDMKQTAHSSLHKLDTSQSEQQIVINSHTTLVESFSDFQNQLERDANGLLQRYREANIQARDAKEPQGFSERYKLTKFRPEQLITKEKLDADQSQLADAKTQLSKAVGKIEQAYQEAIETYPTLESNILNG